MNKQRIWIISVAFLVCLTSIGIIVWRTTAAKDKDDTSVVDPAILDDDDNGSIPLSHNFDDHENSTSSSYRKLMTTIAVVEGETFTRASNGCKQATDRHGYTGEGYADMNYGIDSWVEYDTTIASPNEQINEQQHLATTTIYTLVIRYSINVNDQSRPSEIYINNQLMGVLNFNQTLPYSNWDTAIMEPVELPSTTPITKIGIVGITDRGGPNIDQLSIQTEIQTRNDGNDETIAAAISYSCPLEGTNTTIDGGRQAVIGVSNNLCTLTLVTTENGRTKRIVPIARSYDYQNWEVAPGKYAAALFANGDDTHLGPCTHQFCEIRLPPLMETNNVNEITSYVLTSYPLRQLHKRDEWARFFEQTTFGTKPSDLEDAMLVSSAMTTDDGTDETRTTQKKMADWVHRQMYQVEGTSHRAYWRQRTNPRVFSSEKYGRSDHPCSVNSRWRRFAFTKEDQEMTDNDNDEIGEGRIWIKSTSYRNVEWTDPYTNITSSEVVPRPPFLLVDDNGNPRTVVEDLRWESDTLNERFPYWNLTHGYQICSYPDEYTSKVIHKSSLKLRTRPYDDDDNGSCEAISLGNPAIDFTGFESHIGNFVFQLTEEEHKLQGIDKWKDFTTYSTLAAEFATAYGGNFVFDDSHVRYMDYGYIKLDSEESGTDNNNNVESFIEWTVKVPDTGFYNVSFRYTLAEEINVVRWVRVTVDRVQSRSSEIALTYNDISTYPFWGDSSSVSVFLSEGENKVRATLVETDPSSSSHVAVYIDGMKLVNLQTCENVVSEDVVTPLHDRYILTSGIQNNELCDNIPQHAEPFDTPVFAYHPTEGLLIWDPRLILQSNTMHSPIPDGGGEVEIFTAGRTMCSNAPRTFLNFDHCILSTEPTTCASSTTSVIDEILINLSMTNIGNLYNLTGRYLYTVRGLKLTQEDYGVEAEHPCTLNLVSRWLRHSGTTCLNPTELRPRTEKTLIRLISSASDPNPFMRDITFPSGASCHSNDINNGPTEINIQIGNDCWKRIHPDELSVYDMTYWTLENTHTGNRIAKVREERNPITKWAEDGRHEIWFPDNHPMYRWDQSSHHFDYIGRLGDDVYFRDLSNELRLDQVASYYGLTNSHGGASGNIVCGSPGEEANDPTKGSLFDFSAFDHKLDTTTQWDLSRQREVVHTMIALYAQDQLRQRMAWALTQILVIATPSIRFAWKSTENFVVYTDILVRNAFGNYLDILREISYSPHMADNLSYLGSRSTAYFWDRQRRLQRADENYAREIMQLFSIGLIHLNKDGTPKLDASGKAQDVYTNSHIRSFARAWTGFDNQRNRGNIETKATSNGVDPMLIQPHWRDRFPKTDLFGGYIGDRYPLCADLPKGQFLRKGAKYVLLGNSALPEMMSDDPRIADQKLALGSISSDLYQRLCDKQQSGVCKFPHKVILDSNLPCNDLECLVDTVRVVEVAENMFYEYVQPPCVEHPFYENGLSLHTGKKNPVQHKPICGNPLLPIATSACCTDSNNPTTRSAFSAISANLYHIERMTFATQDERCAGLSRQACTYDSTDNNVLDGDFVYRWTTTSCSVKVKVNPEGEIAIVHDTADVSGNKVTHIDESSQNFFGAIWQNGFYPQVNFDVCGAGCEVVEEVNCLCTTTVEEKAVFSSMPDSKEAILSYLHVGAPDPNSFDSDVYTSFPVADFTVYFQNRPQGGYTYDKNTIFEVIDDATDGRKYFLKNIESRVYVIEDSSDLGNDLQQSNWSFRNPVQFMSLIPSETNRRDAVYETEATLEHYFYHPNTAPFLCGRLIQRFGISNPSPRYVETCANAFIDGQYRSVDGITFGSGNYGDLAATVAAIILDREVRSVVLDADPSHGSVREPLMKILALMRNMDFKTKAENPKHQGEHTPLVVLNDVDEHVVQMFHEIDTVFSFFLPDFAPPESLVSAGTLVAPESQLIDLPGVVNLLNGLHSMIKYGFGACPSPSYSFGLPSESIRSCTVGEYESAFGYLTYSPQCDVSTADIVNDLATLLTAGRLSAANRQAIVTAYDNALAQSEGDRDTALRIAQELITSTPEFHTTNIVVPVSRRESLPSSIVSTQSTRSSERPYQAIVYVFFDGGCDSHQMLVPKECTASRFNDMDAYEQYAETRNPIHLSKESLLPIDGHGQAGCDEFGVNEELEIVQELYNDSDLLFFANAGVLGRHSSNLNYRENSPKNLFSHSDMQRESRTIDIFDQHVGTGVLGRMKDVLTKRNLAVTSLSVKSDSIASAGEPGVSPPSTTVPILESSPRKFFAGSEKVLYKDDFIAAIKNLNNATNPNSGFMAEAWSAALYRALDENEMLYDVLKRVRTDTRFPSSDNELGKKLETVARLIKTREERGADVDLFYVTVGGFDHHFDVNTNLQQKFKDVNSAMEAFTSEMKSQGVWDGVTVVQASEFGRTLMPNSNLGTDHGWGGNYFIAGGSVNGGQILGQYPDDITSRNRELNIGQGRLIPTTSWEQIWNGIAEHHGVDTDDELNYILPNRRSFQDDLFTANDLFNPLYSGGRRGLRG